MSDTPETLAAILAEMRDERIIRLKGADVTRCLLLNLADRIEAAERERDAHTNDIHDALYLATGIPSNTTALREALTEFVDSIQWLCDGDERGIFKKQFAPLLSDARAALSASARNCDRFATAEEAFNAWESDNKKPPEQCFLQWLFAPAEGGAE